MRADNANRFTSSLIAPHDFRRGEPMRALRIAPARQLALFGTSAAPGRCWDGLPEHARAEVLALLARIIARGVLAGGQDPAGGKERNGD
jgi:hypothetical protein